MSVFVVLMWIRLVAALAQTPFTLSGLPVLVEPGGRDPLDEPMPVVDVEDQQAVAAVLEVVADAGRRHVEQPLYVLIGRASAGKDCGQYGYGCQRTPTQMSVHENPPADFTIYDFFQS